MSFIHNHKRLLDKSNIKTALFIVLLLCLGHNDLIKMSGACGKIPIILTNVGITV